MNTCSLDDMLDGSVCIDHLSETEKRAASVYFLCATLNACDSQDCSVDTLQEDVACLRQLSDDKLMSIDAYSDYLNAVAAGASVTNSIDEIEEGIKCLKLLDDTQLYAMQVLLRCRLRACVTA